MKFRAISLLSAGIIAWLLTLPGIAAAVPVFKYDTTYKLSGEFNFGLFGKLKLSEDSILYYNSATDQLTIDATATSSKYKGGSLDLELLLVGATLQHGAVEVGDLVQFDKKNARIELGFDPNGMYKHSRHQIGALTPDYEIKKIKVQANEEFLVFSSMKPLIAVDGKNRLIIQTWMSLWGHGWDVHADPKFYLTELPNNLPPPGNEIPEPMTMGLLATGLLGGAAVRRRNRK